VSSQLTNNETSKVHELNGLLEENTSLAEYSRKKFTELLSRISIAQTLGFFIPYP